MGIDGGCFDFLFPLIGKGYLPNFKKVINEGFYSTLNVTIPPVTIPSWPCIFSGITPYQLGYYFFTHPTNGIFNSRIWKNKAIFSDPSIKNFVLNVPGTYPAWKINGEMISGMLSPSLSCYPKELELIYKKNWIIEGQNIPDIFKEFNLKKKLFIRKLEEDFDLFTYVIKIPDAISHYCHKGMKKSINLINVCYKLIDNFLGELLKNKSVENFIIFSDHGLRIYKKTFNLERWLEKKRLLFVNNFFNNFSFQRFCSHLNYDIKKILMSTSITAITVPIGLMNKFSRWFRLFINIKNNVKNRFYQIQSSSKNKYQVSITKMDRSSIQELNSNVGCLFLYGKDKLKKENIKDKLEKSKYIKKIISPEIEFFPDLLIVLKEKYYFLSEPSLFVSNIARVINHSQEGMFIAYGKNINKGYNDYVNYYDIAPTILKLYNIEKKDFMIGETLKILKFK